MVARVETCTSSRWIDSLQVFSERERDSDSTEPDRSTDLNPGRIIPLTD